MKTRTLRMAAALAVGAGAAIVGRSLDFAFAIILVAFIAWAIAGFLQWRSGLRLRPPTWSHSRKEK